MLPLTGLRVLDLSRLLPGPYATLFLADLGADVVKIEDPQGGDYLRHSPPSLGDDSAPFVAINRNKRSVAIDLKSGAGRGAFLRLARSADVVVESFRPGVIDRLGLSYAELAAANERIILCSISGYGQDGPDRLRAGHDVNYIARAGVLAYGGEAGGPPVLPGVQVGDIGGGSLLGALAILVALHERSKTGRGRHLDVAMCEGSLAFLAIHLGAVLAGGKEAKVPRRGEDTLNGGLPCYGGVFRTRDGRYMALGALEPKFWQAFCAAVERDDLAALGYASGDEGRRVKTELAALFAKRTRDEWVEFARPRDVCLEPVLELDEVLDDPQHAARGLTFEIDDPRLGRQVRQLRTPLRFGDPPRRPAPRLGEHTDEVLREAGLGEPEIAALRRDGAVA